MSSLCQNSSPTAEADLALRAFFDLKDASVRAVDGGRVNRSFRVESRQGDFILQRLSDHFLGYEALGINWHRVYQAAVPESGPAGPPLPPIFPDREGRYLASGPQVPGFWRLTGYLDGRPAVKSADQAGLAARLLGFFHQCLNRPAPLEMEPLPTGEFTNQHLSRPQEFEDIIEQYRGHPHLDDLKPLIEAAGQAARLLPIHPGFVNVFNLKDVVIHGDPKADNFLMRPQAGPGAALLDWDSVGYGHVLVDLAEMLRSWGWLNATEASAVSFDNLAAVVAGYSATGLSLDQRELELLPPVLRAIALNLARRYLTDALAEVYFQWDQRAYPSLYEQNRARAASMLSLAAALAEMEMRLIDLLAAAWNPAGPGP